MRQWIKHGDWSFRDITYWENNFFIWTSSHDITEYSGIPSGSHNNSIAQYPPRLAALCRRSDVISPLRIDMRPKEFGPICRRYVDVSTISLCKNLSVMGDGSKSLVSMVQHYGRPQSDISSHSHNMKRRILIWSNMQNPTCRLLDLNSFFKCS